MTAPEQEQVSIVLTREQADLQLEIAEQVVRNIDRWAAMDAVGPRMILERDLNAVIAEQVRAQTPEVAGV